MIIIISDFDIELNPRATELIFHTPVPANKSFLVHSVSVLLIYTRVMIQISNCDGLSRMNSAFCLLLLSYGDFCKIDIHETHQSQSFWNKLKIRAYILLGPIWARYAFKGVQQTTLVDKELTHLDWIRTGDHQLPLPPPPSGA